jgi:hypothetical protein
MKICKVKITKTKIGNMTKFSYPAGYDKEKISPFIYQNEGLETESCLATVADDFNFTVDMEQVTSMAADEIIEDWINSDISIQSAVSLGKMTEEDVAEIISRKQENTK